MRDEVVTLTPGTISSGAFVPGGPTVRVLLSEWLAAAALTINMAGSDQYTRLLIDFPVPMSYLYQSGPASSVDQYGAASEHKAIVVGNAAWTAGVSDLVIGTTYDGHTTVLSVHFT